MARRSDPAAGRADAPSPAGAAKTGRRPATSWLGGAPAGLFVALVAGSVAIIAIGSWLAHTPGPLPPPPPRRTRSGPPDKAHLRQTYYRAQVDEDRAALGLPKLRSLAPLRRPHPYALELSEPRRLRAGKKLSSKSLELKLVARKLWLGPRGRGVRTRHAVLRIANATNHHLAYRIQTRIAGHCERKTYIAHNAIALAPREAVERTECLMPRKPVLVIERIETMQLTPLGYHYVSRLSPGRIGYDTRTSSGHRYERAERCKLIPWRTIRSGLRADEVAWRDIIDFYARHNCDEYTFFVGYRWSAKGIETLPAAADRD